MKLNIGCGGNRLRGYVNIDSNPGLRPDRIMQAYDLDFKSGSVEEITANHLIEHLGFFKTKYFLSECFRVLKTGGILKIETPRIEKTFKIFLKAKNARVREKALGWVYGAETDGMGHKYCFPVELMEKLTAEAGFKILKKEFYNYESSRPACRFVLRKPKHSRLANLQAEFRKELLKRKIPCFTDEQVSSEQEKIIEKVMCAIKEGV
ncbi:MAG: methyltransferase domain-containing protein [Elusimicrobia bacterium]|nr:methyltransferase domain-containing protein [Elusimicrobiota bacterium]